MVTLIAVAVVLLCAFGGWRKGLLLTLLSLAGLIAAYAVTYFGYRAVGDAICSRWGLQPILAYPVGATVCFFGVTCLVGVASFVVGRIWRRRRGHGALGTFDRAGGAVAGAIYGTALVWIVVTGLLLAQVLLPRRAPPVHESLVGRAAAPLASRAAAALTRRLSGSQPLAATASRLTADPLRARRGLEAVLGDRRVKRLARDPRFVEQLAAGDLPAIARDPTFAALSRDRRFLAAARDAGLLDDDASSPAAVQRQLAARMVPPARVVVALAKDPELRQLAQEIAAQRREQRDPLALANDPRFNRLARRVLEILRTAPRLPEGLPPPS